MNGKLPNCDGVKGCENQIVYICEKGWVYCAEHHFHGGRRSRKLRPWELAILRAGQVLPSYTPINKPKCTCASYYDMYPGLGENCRIHPSFGIEQP